jgi:Flp pilus assembly pilin Flp
MASHAWVRRFLREELGQDLVEYVLLLACLSLTVIVVMQSLGTTVTGKYSGASTAVNDAGTGARGGGNPGNPTPGAGTPGQGNPGSGNPGQGGGPGGGPGGGNPGGGNPGNGKGGGKP